MEEGKEVKGRKEDQKLKACSGLTGTGHTTKGYKRYRARPSVPRKERPL